MYAKKDKLQLRTLSIVLMAGACLAGLSGCSSSDDVAEPNPTYNPAAGTVNTLFALNISTSTSPTTRMSVSNTQADNTNFRGIDNAKLLTYELRDGDNLNNGTFVTTATNATNIFSLDNISGITASSASKVMTLNLKVNTNTVMFYGKAIKNGTDQAQGKITYNVSTTASDTKFQLQPRLTDNTNYTVATTALAGILNDILGVSYTTSDPATTTTWKSYYDRYTNNETVGSMTALEKDLAKAYDNFYTIPSGEARSGSGSAILRMVSDLMKTVSRIQSSTDPSSATLDVTTNNALVRNVAQAIIDKLKGKTEDPAVEGLFDYDTTNEVFSFKEAQSAYANFPTSFNLPKGAAQLENNEGAFRYKTNVALANSSGESYTDLMWPAELCYYGNSPIKCSTVVKEESDYPTSLVDWNNSSDTKWTDFTDNSAVTNATRAVAMKYPVNYGTALLETTVQYGAEDLSDNNATLHPGETANIIKASVAGTGETPSPFTLTGVLVGGQYKEMGWDFTKTTDATLCTIYDNDINNGTIPVYDTSKTAANQQASGSNYTLVFDNYVANSGTQNTVYVCLEFVNNSGKDFYGNQNLIAAGETFYLIGRLDLGSQTVTIPAEKVLTTTRVFIQDYKTKAKFVIGPNSLKSAFVTVPDLRASDITLGLAVDLTWETGPVFDGDDHNGIILGN